MRTTRELTRTPSTPQSWRTRLEANCTATTCAYVLYILHAAVVAVVVEKLLCRSNSVGRADTMLINSELIYSRAACQSNAKLMWMQTHREMKPVAAVVVVVVVLDGV